jgi:TolB-like protein/tetratricopeptide (TPR) repeat protein
MGEESPKPASTPTGAVFLSYASQDAEAAARICNALRAAGIEVWFDQNELRGGDVWDEKIRRQIHDCVLFMPVISANTASRHEGYFRLEWDLADQRSHMIARSHVFVVPVCLDATTEAAADVPESFKRVQWTRLPAGQTPADFGARIHQLLSSDSSHSPTLPRTSRTAPPARLSRPKPAWLAVAVLLAALAAYLFAEKPWTVKPGPPSKSATSADTPVAFDPPPHSIAVLPFVNMSGDPNQQYFSDGMTEELLNSLSRINELQVAARTSSFSFQGEHPDITTVAHKLNVGAVLEGSVRRSGQTVRITTQLVNGVTGFHLWSETYDRDLSDVLKLQTEIANAVAGALKVTLLGDVVAKIELGGTRNPAAFDAYLHGQKAHSTAHDDKGFQTAIAAYTEAIELDPNFALAFAQRSYALSAYADWASGPVVRESFDKAEANALKVIELAPGLAEGHMALAFYLQSGALDFTRAHEEYERALALAPGNAQVLLNYGHFAVQMGRTEAGLAAVRHAVVLDPLNLRSHRVLGSALRGARRYDEAIRAFNDALALDPADLQTYAWRGLAYIGLGDLQNARSSCEIKSDFWASHFCLAIVYDKLGRHTDAQNTFDKFKAGHGDDWGSNFAAIYAQWGNTSRALEWLETALRARDSGLEGLKTDPLMDPLRKQPRFQAIERELKFPD